MKLKFMPFLVGAMALAMSTAPVRVRAEAPSQSSNSAPDLAQRSNLSLQQLSTISAMNLASNQEAQMQKIEQALTFEHIKPILTSGQHQLWLQMRRAEYGGN